MKKQKNKTKPESAYIIFQNNNAKKTQLMIPSDSTTSHLHFTVFVNCISLVNVVYSLDFDNFLFFLDFIRLAPPAQSLE